MKHGIGRRDFLRRSALAGAGFWAAGRALGAQEKSPNAKLDIALVGLGTQGMINLNAVRSQNITALCDVDGKALADASSQYPRARTYADFRKMIEKAKDIDAVVVSTPDHLHAFVSVPAMNLGKHVYCEKPLAHSVWEARRMAEIAAKAKVATQMGTQCHSQEHYRNAAELLLSDVIGTVKEVHAWSAAAHSGKERPADTPPVPGNLDWDLWLGPAPERPYHPAYHPFSWRGWWDFGTGSLGDFGCHIMDMAFWTLQLRHPSTVEAEGPAPHPESTPEDCVVRYAFPAIEGGPARMLTWYHGTRKPAEKLVDGAPLPRHGAIFVGDKGRMLLPHYGQPPRLFPETKFAGFRRPQPFLYKTPGHHEDWILKCKDGGRPECHFGHAGLLTETVLLGNAAFRAGKKIAWDAENLKAKDAPEADPFLHREYRKGWAL